MGRAFPGASGVLHPNADVSLESNNYQKVWNGSSSCLNVIGCIFLPCFGEIQKVCTYSVLTVIQIVISALLSNTCTGNNQERIDTELSCTFVTMVTRFTYSPSTPVLAVAHCTTTWQHSAIRQFPNQPPLTLPPPPPAPHSHTTAPQTENYDPHAPRLRTANPPAPSHTPTP